MALPYKIIVCGDKATGKSALIAAILKQFNGRNVGVTSVIDVKVGNADVSFTFWEPKIGQDAASAPVTYFVGAKGAILVFEATRKETFEGCKLWYQRALPLCGKKIPYILVANKIDLGWKFDKNEVLSFAEKNSIPLIECSSLQGINIAPIIESMILLMEGKEPVTQPSAQPPVTPVFQETPPETITKPAPSQLFPSQPPQEKATPEQQPSFSLPTQEATQQPLLTLQPKESEFTQKVEKTTTPSSVLSSLDAILAKTAQLSREVKGVCVSPTASQPPAEKAPEEKTIAPTLLFPASQPPAEKAPEEKTIAPTLPSPEEKTVKAPTLSIQKSSLLLSVPPTEEAPQEETVSIVEDKLIRPSLFAALKQTVEARKVEEQPISQVSGTPVMHPESVSETKVEKESPEQKLLLDKIHDVQDILKSIIGKLDYHARKLS